MYNPQKVSQIIGYLLCLNNGSMNLLRLMKELYLIDRESINERDVSLTGDDYVSMNRGPVLSKTYNMLQNLGSVRSESVWSAFFKSSKSKYYPDISLETSPGEDRLSAKDKEYIEHIFNEYKNFGDSDGFELAEFTHSFPEWRDPSGSIIDIRFSDVMRALGKSEEEISDAKIEHDQLGILYESLGIV